MCADVQPVAGFNFVVEIDGVAAAGFSEASGIGAEITVIEYRSANDPNTVRKFPGLRKHSNVTLKRGITLDRELWSWFRQARDGNVVRRSMSIVLLDDARQPVARFNFSRAWPCRWEGPTLRAEGSEVAIETLEICHEGMEVE